MHYKKGVELEDVLSMGGCARVPSSDRTILEWRGRIGSEDGSKCLLALGDVYVELDDFEEVVDV